MRLIILGFTLIVIETFISLSRVACAATGDGRDLVYAARYYLPAGSSGRSYVHLYRIKPDGTGKIQLTQSQHDDIDPLWSPDGRRIAFIRADRWLCTISSDRRSFMQVADLGQDNFWSNLRWSPDGRTLALVTESEHASGIHFFDLQTRQRRYLRDVEEFEWSPDGRYLSLVSKSGAFLLDLTTHRKVKLPKAVTHVTWLSSEQLAVSLAQNTDSDEFPIAGFAVYDRAGREIRRLKQQARNPYGIYEANQVDPRSTLARVPGRSDAFVLVWDESTSGGRSARYFHIKADTGAARELAAGQTFAPAPDGNRFAFAPYYQLTPYDVLKNGHRRVVYTSSLIVTNLKSKRTVVDGLVLIHGCDWRKLQVRNALFLVSPALSDQRRHYTQAVQVTRRCSLWGDSFND